MQGKANKHDIVLGKMQGNIFSDILIPAKTKEMADNLK